MTAVPELWGQRQDGLGGCRVSEKFCLKETAKRTIAEHLTLPLWPLHYIRACPHTHATHAQLKFKNTISLSIYNQSLCVNYAFLYRTGHLNFFWLRRNLANQPSALLQCLCLPQPAIPCSFSLKTKRKTQGQGGEASSHWSALRLRPSFTASVLALSLGVQPSS